MFTPFFGQFTSLLLFLIGIGSSSIPSVEEGLIAYYNFNECDARDVSGNDSHGKLFGDVACWCGIEDEGLLFDGIDDYVEFYGKVNNYFTTSDFTISFYFKPQRNIIFNQSLLSKRAACTDYNMIDLLLSLNDRIIETKIHETPNKYHGKVSPSLVSAGWHHIAIVREGLRAATYINGQMVKENFRCSGLDISNSTPLSFSNSPCIESNRTKRFQGILDELKIFKRALSSKEIQLLYELHPIENAKMDCVS